MPLESVLLLLDNSEHARNGDYPPTRISSMLDAANYMAGSVCNGNPESTCGVLSMGGGAQLLSSPSDNLGKILGCMHGLSSTGTSNVVQAVMMGLLALKHRRNKNGGQRIVVFVASPVGNTEKEVVKAGKVCKKNNVGVDVVVMGELESNEPICQKLVDAANSNDNSHVVTVPVNCLPSDILISSPIGGTGGGGGGGGGFRGDDPELAAAMAASMAGTAGVAAPAPAAEGGANDGFEFGIDPSMDPELAMALRVSMEEEKRRMEEIKKKEETEKKDEGKKEDGSSMDVDSAPAAAAATEGGGEEDLLAQALAMSMKEEEGGETAGAAAAPTFYEGMTAGVTDEDEAMQLALAMSMAQEGEEEEEKEGKGK